mmetsp:Transcript_72494/g.216271  ORF Transcript_72494/g.216271 Transcript_72494/m.216271 type:complete len:210 (+) Transcript_72494:128-757(+)
MFPPGDRADQDAPARGLQRGDPRRTDRIRSGAGQLPGALRQLELGSMPPLCRRRDVDADRGFGGHGADAHRGRRRLRCGGQPPATVRDLRGFTPHMGHLCEPRRQSVLQCRPARRLHRHARRQGHDGGAVGLRGCARLDRAALLPQTALHLPAQGGQCHGQRDHSGHALGEAVRVPGLEILRVGLVGAGAHALAGVAVGGQQGGPLRQG